MSQDPEDLNLLAQQLRQSRGIPKRELRSLPKTVLLGIAIELDPDMVSEILEKGDTKEDILQAIEHHVRASLGRQDTAGWPYLQDFDVIFTEIGEEEE